MVSVFMDDKKKGLITTPLFSVGTYQIVDVPAFVLLLVQPFNVFDVYSE